MPADPGPRGLAECDLRTGLADSELAAIIRSAADEIGLAGEFHRIALHADCGLEAGHEGLHGGWVATTNDDESATCWLRWDETTRLLDWLAACVRPECLLYRGHPGACNLMCDDEESASAR